MSVDHYENFPVASWLCPPALRAPIAAIYQFARTADDIADEGDAPALQRLGALEHFRRELVAALAGDPSPGGRWPEVFGPLREAITAHRLPGPLLHNLLDAFEQDVAFTAHARHYAAREQLLDYCRRSANPIGRLLLHLYGIADAAALAQSDAICSALQLANFWQDLSVDLKRGRHYLPLSDCAAFGLDPAADPRAMDAAAFASMVESLVAWTRELMRQGAPLARRLPGRIGWELRLVVQGGLRILDHIEAMGCDTRSARPRIAKRDFPIMAWRACRM